MRTQEQYLEKLAGMKHNLYINGECVGRDDPRVIRASNAIRMTFTLAQNPEYEELLTATSHITGKKINRFTHIHQSADDLLKKQEVTRMLCTKVGGCIQRCMGCDMLNGISITSKHADLMYDTHYNENFLKFLEYFQENDLTGAGSQTDPKGDRILRPAEQWDPDQYLHVVERRKDGVVVRGCKLHNTMAAYADELIVIPTRMMKPDEKDYAIAFAIPADTEGVKIICKAVFADQRPDNLAAPISNNGDIECMTIFDNVFVPNDRIFLNGETDLAGQLALGFALYHRHSYTGCKPGMADILMGTTALIAKYNDILKQSHVKEKLVDMISVAELTYAAGIAAGYKSKRDEFSGTQVPDVIYANVGRRHAGHNMYHEANILCDIAGGLVGTIPGDADYNSAETGDYIRKYITRREGVPAEDIYKIYRLAEDYINRESGSTLLIAGVHGGGSPIMEDIAIMATYDLNSKMEYAKKLAGIDD